jgi:hypothetical protein
MDLNFQVKIGPSGGGYVGVWLERPGRSDQLRVLLEDRPLPRVGGGNNDGRFQ